MTMGTQTATSIKRLAKSVFETRTTRFKIIARATYTMCDYWDGGSREYCRAINLSTGEIRQPFDGALIPWRGLANATFPIPAGVGILVHSIFCGHDRGITLYVAPGNQLAEVSR
jgi:hypothetical protein